LSVLLTELDDDFKDCLKEFIPLIVGPHTLTPKKINGSCIRAKDLIFYIQEYVDMFESDKLPNALNIFEVNFFFEFISTLCNYFYMYLWSLF